VLDFITRQVDVECLPGNIPQKLLIDVSGLEIGDHRELRHLQVPEGVELMEELDRVVVSVAAPRLEEAEVEEEEVLIEAAVAEPEVIGKGKPDDEEERG
jgi:large subunit ribosomal protein L25